MDTDDGDEADADGGVDRVVMATERNDSRLVSCDDVGDDFQVLGKGPPPLHCGSKKPDPC